MSSPPALAVPAEPTRVLSASASRVTSIDALRGLVMFTMIFVNDIAGVSTAIVPPWLRHFAGRSGMTFVDLVFPAFLFIVGLSIPFALGARLNRGDTLGRTLLHVVLRTVSLLGIGILMVNGTPESTSLGWSGPLWSALMYVAAILAFCSMAVPLERETGSDCQRVIRRVTLGLRCLGLLVLVGLAFVFRGADGRRLIAVSPFSIHTSWYGILGLIGWAYLVGSMVFLIFRQRRTALLGSTVLLLSLYAADRTGLFEGFWLDGYVDIGGVLGAHGAITVAGILLGSILLTEDTATFGARLRFTLLFIAGFAAAALLFEGLYGINKNAATPAWCLWACAVTAFVWLVFHLVSEVHPVPQIYRPFAVFGENVLLAYLLSCLLPSLLDLLSLGVWYGRLAEPHLGAAIARSAGCALALLCVTAGLNRLGFRLRL